ncbi:MAG: phosphatidylserine decarboxylase family protein [Candidatus Riflebacteria bacterium]|nr:phosphatidylserine decarboxylase family protein [Candidatus Riflebacteria bacterium]
MRSPIHPEAFPFTVIFAFGSYIFNYLGKSFPFLGRLFKSIGYMFSILALFTLYFFRDPERVIPQDENAIVSPADGTVLKIDDVPNAPFFNGPAKRVAIFLSIFNVHINRSPINGKIVYRNYNPGKFFPANLDKASEDNEQNSIGITDGDFKVLVRQIAGIIARRIICWNNPGDALEKGERFGLIRFGSRTELYMPPGTTIEVKPGQKVQGGSTVIARRKK